MLTWWIWVDRPSGNWLISLAGETTPKHQVKHIKISVPCETVVLERPRGPRWMIAAIGVLRVDTETQTIVIVDELEERLIALEGELKKRVGELEKTSHPPITPNEVEKLDRRVSDLEIKLGMRKELA